MEHLLSENKKLKTLNACHLYERWNNFKTFKDQNIINEIKNNEEAIEKIMKGGYGMYLTPYIKLNRDIFLKVCLSEFCIAGRDVDVYDIETQKSAIKMQDVDEKFIKEYCEKSLELKYCTLFDFYFTSTGILPWKKVQFIYDKTINYKYEHVPYSYVMLYPRLIKYWDIGTQKIDFASIWNKNKDSITKDEFINCLDDSVQIYFAALFYKEKIEYLTHCRTHGY